MQIGLLSVRRRGVQFVSKASRERVWEVTLFFLVVSCGDQLHQREKSSWPGASFWGDHKRHTVINRDGKRTLGRSGIKDQYPQSSNPMYDDH